MKVLKCTLYYYYGNEQEREVSHYLLRGTDEVFTLSPDPEKYSNEDTTDFYEYRAKKIDQNQYEVTSTENDEVWTLISDSGLTLDSFIFGRWKNSDDQEEGMIALELME